MYSPCAFIRVFGSQPTVESGRSFLRDVSQQVCPDNKWFSSKKMLAAFLCGDFGSSADEFSVTALFGTKSTDSFELCAQISFLSRLIPEVFGSHLAQLTPLWMNKLIALLTRRTRDQLNLKGISVLTNAMLRSVKRKAVLPERDAVQADIWSRVSLEAWTYALDFRNFRDLISELEVSFSRFTIKDNKTSSTASAPSKRMCYAVLRGEACPSADTCNYRHDIASLSPSELESWRKRASSSGNRSSSKKHAAKAPPS